MLGHFILILSIFSGHFFSSTGKILTIDDIQRVCLRFSEQYRPALSTEKSPCNICLYKGPTTKSNLCNYNVAKKEKFQSSNEDQ